VLVITSIVLLVLLLLAMMEAFMGDIALTKAQVDLSKIDAALSRDEGRLRSSWFTWQNIELCSIFNSIVCSS
jgi:hypothetical protein